MFIVQILSLGFLGLYVWKTWQMASSTKASVEASEKMIAEMINTRDQESAPYVVPFININHHVMYFGIKNIGKTVAKNIKLQIDPELKQYIRDDKKDIPLIKNGLSSLPPGHEIGTKFAVSHVYLNQPDSPKIYSVKLSFFGGINNVRREYEQIFDLSVYHDLIPDEDKRLSDVVKELVNLANNSQRIAEFLEKFNDSFAEGIWIKNPDLFIQIISDNATNRLIIISKLNELSDILLLMADDSVAFLPEDLKPRIKSLALQLTVISSICSPNLTQLACKKIDSLIRDILELCESDAFIYSRKLEGFVEKINSTKVAIDELKESIS